MCVGSVIEFHNVSLLHKLLRKDDFRPYRFRAGDRVVWRMDAKRALGRWCWAGYNNRFNFRNWLHDKSQRNVSTVAFFVRFWSENETPWLKWNWWNVNQCAVTIASCRFYCVRTSQNRQVFVVRLCTSLLSLQSLLCKGCMSTTKIIERPFDNLSATPEQMFVAWTRLSSKSYQQLHGLLGTRAACRCWPILSALKHSLAHQTLLRMSELREKLRLAFCGGTRQRWEVEIAFL